MDVIGGFRSDLSITGKIDGNFGSVPAGVLFSKVAYQRKRWQAKLSNMRERDVAALGLFLFYHVTKRKRCSE